MRRLLPRVNLTEFQSLAKDTQTTFCFPLTCAITCLKAALNPD